MIASLNAKRFGARAVLGVLALGLSVAPARAGPGLVAVQQDGTTVYVNDGVDTKTRVARSQPASQPHSVLAYWSRTQHAWVPVPPPSPWAMRAARSAAQEVRRYVIAQPRMASYRRFEFDPGYAGLANGHVVSAEQIDDAISRAASRHKVDPNLVRAMIKVESNFNPHAVSRTGAMGLMQLMPGTARELGVSNPFDPEQNVDAGVRHIKQLLSDYNGNVALSLAAYNAGAAAVMRNNGIPPYQETQAYVRRITRLYRGDSKDLQTIPTHRAPIQVTRTAEGGWKISNTE